MWVIVNGVGHQVFEVVFPFCRNRKDYHLHSLQCVNNFWDKHFICANC